MKPVLLGVVASRRLFLEIAILVVRNIMHFLDVKDGGITRPKLRLSVSAPM